MILWRKITKNLRELYREANLNNKKTVMGIAQPLKLRPPKEEGHVESGRNRREPAPIHRMTAWKLVTLGCTQCTIPPFFLQIFFASILSDDPIP